MPVGFFLQGNSAGYIRMAKLMIASVRQTMPSVEVWHLTDAATPMVEGSFGVKRVSEPMPMGVRRVMHYAACAGEWLFVDCDVIVQSDVQEVFNDKNFDVAVTDRIGTDMEGTPYAEAMPYNFGVVFSRCPRFWMDAEATLRTLGGKLQEWQGEQIVLAAMVRNPRGYKVKILPGAKYNLPPRGTKDPLIESASILHFKGARKKTLLEKAT